MTTTSLRSPSRLALALALLGLIALLLVPGAQPAAAQTEQAPDPEPAGPLVSPPRLLVADGVESQVAVVDPAAGAVLETLDIPGIANVYSGGTGEYGYAVQYNEYGVDDGDVTNVIDIGLDFANETGTMQLREEAPSLLPFSLDGADPIHFTAHEERVAIFNDLTGAADVLDEGDLEDADAGPEVLTLESGAAHHGVAVPLGDVVLMTVKGDDDSTLPIGVEVRTLDNTTLQRFEGCPRLHGEATAGHDLIGYGCSDGVLLIERLADGTFTSRKVANPPDAEEDRRAGTLVAVEGVPFMIGNFGPDQLLRVDLETGESRALVLPAPLLRFQLDAEGRLLVLTADGALHLVDPANGDIIESVPVITAYEPGAGFDLPGPRLSLASEAAFVTDPATGEVVEVAMPAAGEALGLEVTQRIDVGGAPASLAVLQVAAPEPARYDFEATVTSGPSEGTTLAGPLELQVADDGTVTGTLTLDGAAAPVSGRLSDANLVLQFDLGEGAYVFGIGAADADGVFRGTFLGPQAGDFGTWTATAAAEPVVPEPAETIVHHLQAEYRQGSLSGETLDGTLTLQVRTTSRGRLLESGTLVLDDGVERAVDGVLLDPLDRLAFVVDYQGRTLAFDGHGTPDEGYEGRFAGPEPDDRGRFSTHVHAEE